MLCSATRKFAFLSWASKTLFLWSVLFFAPPQFVLAQEGKTINGAVEALLAMQTRSLPGQASYEIGRIADNPRYQACLSWEASLPEGTHAWGRISANVRCTNGPKLSIYVSVKVRLDGHYLVAARPIPANKPIEAADLNLIEGELTAQAQDILFLPEQVIGRSSRSFVSTGRPLRLILLRPEAIIEAGQEVKVVVYGPGFSASNTGHALSSAAKGETLRVRLQNGQVLRGTASEKGIVESRF